MAKSIKLMLINKEDTSGNGLKSIRTRESELIDITDWEPAVSDTTLTSAHELVVKDNRVYEIIKTYIDLDKGWRIFLATELTESFDIVPPTT